jgi:hypothetical protein
MKYPKITKGIKNEYRMEFFNNANSSNIQKVFIFADNHHQATDIVMNTWDIPKQWIVSNSMFRKSIPVTIQGLNISEIY